jgi:hypothetical protein
MILSAYGVCQGAPRRDHDLFDTHPLNPSAESWTIRRVSVSQQIPRCGVPRKGLRNLAGKPHLGGILGHAKMNDFSPVVVKHDQGIEDPKRRGGDNEHIDRHGVSQVIVQKAAPSRGGGPGASRQIPPDRGLADINAELEQFAMDARRAPERVGRAALSGTSVLGGSRRAASAS